MLSLDSPLKKLLLVYSLWIGASVFSGSLLYLYFKDAGMGDFDLAFSFLFWPVAPVLLILFLHNRKKTDFRKYMSSAMLLMSASYLLLFIFEPVKELLFLNSFILGLTCFLFWVPFNIMYFELNRGKAATLGTVYFSMGSILGLMLPVASAVIAQALGFRVLFLISAAVFAFLPAAVRIIGKREYQYNLADALRETKGFKTLAFVEGIYGGGVSAAMVVITLWYFSTPLALGIFSTLTTLFSVAASFVMSRLSDITQKRRRYINLFGCGLGIATALMGFASGIWAWFAAVSARGFFASLFYPFTTAILVDNRRDMPKLMVGREWLLNIGRVVGISIVLFCAIALSIQVSLTILGLLILLYPVIIELKKRHISVN